VHSFQDELVEGAEIIYPATFAGTIPQDRGIAPRVRAGSTWFNLLWLLPIGSVLLIVAVAVAKGLRELPGLQWFMRQFPGMSELTADAPSGLPAWLGWRHFLTWRQASAARWSTGFPQLLHTVLDTADVRGLAEFYRQLLGLQYRPGDEPTAEGFPDDVDWLVLTDAQGIVSSLFSRLII
jgi:hypothetical protein